MAELPSVDRRWRALGEIYRDARRRLEQLVRDALERGAQGTEAYRREQLAAVRRELARLQDRAVPMSAEAAQHAYSVGARAADQVLGRPELAFSGIHRDALEVLADNIANRLNEAAVTVGRRTEDAFRRIGLQETAAGIATGAARREVSEALMRRLIDEGVTDATTGFVDAGGRRWPLDTYAEMVARTTTREAVSQGTANRLEEAGDFAIEITQHANSCKICIPYQGRAWALPGHQVEGLKTIDRLPPFHPNCRHVTTPAHVTFERFEAALEQAGQELDAGGPDALEQTAARPDVHAGAVTREASRDDESERRHRAQRQAYELDPGPEPGAEEARRLAQDLEARGWEVRHADDLEALKEAMGPDLVAALEDYARSGVSWARDEDLYRSLIAGETTIEDVTELAEKELAARNGRRYERLRHEHERGFRTGAFPCFICGKFKRRPADVCNYCGDDPVTYRGSAEEFNRAYGYSH